MSQSPRRPREYSKKMINKLLFRLDKCALFEDDGRGWLCGRASVGCGGRGNGEGCVDGDGGRACSWREGGLLVVRFFTRLTSLGWFFNSRILI